MDPEPSATLTPSSTDSEEETGVGLGGVSPTDFENCLTGTFLQVIIVSLAHFLI